LNDFQDAGAGELLGDLAKEDAGNLHGFGDLTAGDNDTGFSRREIEDAVDCILAGPRESHSIFPIMVINEIFFIL
jgi:hypothetical protein